MPDTQHPGDCDDPGCEAKGHYASARLALNAARIEFIVEKGPSHPYEEVALWSVKHQNYVYEVGCPEPCPVCDTEEE